MQARAAELKKALQKAEAQLRQQEILIDSSKASVSPGMSGPPQLPVEDGPSLP
jgi:hypothetical protein